MITTVGIVLLNPNKQILIGHPTKHPYNKWSIIKGESEKNEAPIITIRREFFEETSLILKLMCEKNLVDISDKLKKTYIYKHGKKELYGFLGILSDNIDISFFKCQSFVKSKDNLPDFPEIDAFTWINYTEISILHETQQALIYDIFNDKVISKLL